MANSPLIIDFTNTNVWNPAAGRRRLGIDLDAINTAIAAAAASAIAGPPGPVGATGAAGPTGPAGSDAFVPTGTILHWVGINPPAGFAICDGSNGTPDLHSQFFVVQV